MDLLLDTHTLIWFLNGDGNLSNNVKIAIEDPNKTSRQSGENTNTICSLIQ